MKFEGKMRTYISRHAQFSVGMDERKHSTNAPEHVTYKNDRQDGEKGSPGAAHDRKSHEAV